MKNKFVSIFLFVMLLFFVAGCQNNKESKIYTIAFDTDGGSIIANQEVVEGQKINKPEDPVKEGYTFKGWYCNEEEWVFIGYVVTSDITLKAKWDINKYTLTFKDYEGNVIKTLKQDYNTPINEINFDDFIREGYTFNGWDNEIPNVMPSRNITLNQTWKINQYTLKFLDNDGTEIQSITQDYNTKIVVPNAPVKEGYNFVGWDQEIPEYMPSANLTFKAIYDKIINPISLLDLQCNPAKYSTDEYIYSTVRLVRTIGNNMYLEDAEEHTIKVDSTGKTITGKGSFYANYGYAAPFYRYYKIGDVFDIRFKLEWNENFGAQLISLSKFSSAIEEKFELPNIQKIDADKLNYKNKQVKNDKGEIINDLVSDLSNYVNKVITLDNLLCVSIDKNPNKEFAYIVKMKNSNGNIFDICFSNMNITNWKIEEVFTIGKKYTITGGISYNVNTDGYYCLLVGDAPRYDNGIINPEDKVRLNDILLK